LVKIKQEKIKNNLTKKDPVSKEALLCQNSVVLIEKSNKISKYIKGKIKYEKNRH
jgi:hypothetical protein